MNQRFFFMTGLAVSIAVHVMVFAAFMVMGKQTAQKKVYSPSVLVPVAEEKKPVEPKKIPMIRKIVEKPIKKPEPVPSVPQNPKETKTPQKSEDVKPVFGMKADNLSNAASGGVAVRTGNTLMKEQETKPTPPSKVKPFVPVPVFELNTLPVFRKKIVPEYPEALKNDGRQGEVILSADIDEHGKIADVRVVKASHPLFAQMAVDALKRSLFSPATRNGKAVATVLDDLVYTFILDK